MPLLQTQDVYTLRIQAGQVEIRRVYLDSTLLWGLYDVTYHLAGGTQSSNPIGEYVWGVADENLPKPSWLNQPYYTKFQGWYEGVTYVTAIPAITKDFHKDLELYAKWTQRKYTYSGTYSWQWTETIHHGGGGDDGGGYGRSRSGLEYGGSANTYYWTNNNIFIAQSWTNSMPNCTCYVYGRCLELGLPTPVNSVRNGGNWHNDTNWDRDRYYDGIEIHPGDLIEGGGHIFFCEDSGTATASWYTSGGSSLQERSDLYYSTHRFWHSTSIANEIANGCHGDASWVLRNPGGGEGGGWDETIVHTEYRNFAETDCPSQKPPTLPNPPQGNWTQTQQNTYTRDYNYSSNTWGSWNFASSSWDTSGSDWI